MTSPDELEALRKLVRIIACQNDAAWGRQMAREYLGLGPMPGRRTVWHWVEAFFRGMIRGAG